MDRRYLSVDRFGLKSVAAVAADGPLDHLAGAFQNLGGAFEFPASRDAAVELGAADGERKEAAASVPGSALRSSRALILTRNEMNISAF